MNEVDEIPCILVRQEDGALCWEPAGDYYRNPRPDTYVIREQRKRQEVQQ